jgi:hypothetical protein
MAKAKVDKATNPPAADAVNGVTPMTDTTIETPEVETDENGRKRPAVSKQEFLDSAGKVTSDIFQAAACRYTLLGSGATNTWTLSEANAAEINALAFLGVKTLQTNEISQVRNNPKNVLVVNGKKVHNPDPAILDEAMTAMIERFAGIREGDWNRDREGGPRVNKPELAGAICDVLVQAKKKTQADVDGGYLAEVLAKLDNQPDWLAQMRKYPPVAAAYVLRVGRTGDTTLDDLLK